MSIFSLGIINKKSTHNSPALLAIGIWLELEILVTNVPIENHGWGLQVFGAPVWHGNVVVSNKVVQNSTKMSGLDMT